MSPSLVNNGRSESDNSVQGPVQTRVSELNCRMVRSVIVDMNRPTRGDGGDFDFARTALSSNR